MGEIRRRALLIGATVTTIGAITERGSDRLVAMDPTGGERAVSAGAFDHFG